MPRVLIWHDKHGDYIYDAETNEQLHDAAVRILEERLERGYIFWPEDHEERAQKIVEGGEGPAAMQLLRERSDHEYEGISIDFLR